MSLANIQGKLSRIEMKSIMAGSGAWICGTNWYNGQCKCDVCEGGTPTVCGFPCAPSNCGH